MKKLFAVALTTAVALSHYAQADSPVCYPLVHGEDGLGSTNSMYLPNLYTAGSEWYSVIFVTNTQKKPVNVKLNFFNFNGSTYIPYDTRQYGQFSSSNSPLSLDLGGAILRENQTGQIIIHDNALDHTKGMVGKVSWQADSCLDKAIVVNVRTVHTSSQRYDQGLVFLNGGNPF